MTTHQVVNHYIYDRRTLLITYGIFFFVSLIVALLGLRAFLLNGVNCDTTFSTILLTTRNPDLDQIAEGHCLGAQPLSKDISGLKLRFGVLNGADAKHAAFGVENSVSHLTKGDQVY